MVDACFIGIIVCMNLASSFRIAVCRLIAIAVLFSQLAVSAYACPMLTQPIDSGVESVASELTTQRMPCELPMNGGDLELPSLCAEHCQQPPQSDQINLSVVPVLTLVSLYPLPVLVAASAPRRSIQTVDSTPEKPPPLTILHCRFRI